MLSKSAMLTKMILFNTERDAMKKYFFSLVLLNLLSLAPTHAQNDRGGCSIKAGGDSNPWRADSHARVGEAPRKRSRIYKSFARSHPKSKMRFAERSQK
jgi:hypothetical protein